jgi:chemotaxis protein MotB
MLQPTTNYKSAICTGVILAGTVLLTSACVTQSKYDALEKQKVALELANETLILQDVQLYETNVVLGRELEIRDAEVAILEAERDDISMAMNTLIVAGTVKMELMKSGLNLILDESVLFASGSATIKPEGAKAIAALVEELKEIPYQIVVIGNSDNVPVGANLAEKFPSNWALAAARSSAVVALMADEGIPSQQLVAVSLGDTQPIASNDTPEGRAENRRIEVRLRPITK